MTFRIDENALAAVSNGPNPPPTARLRAAVEFVRDRTRADQIILFGSAARAEFGAESDFDFAAVVPPGRQPTWPGNQHRWRCPQTGDQIDVLFADREQLEKRRWTPGTVHCSVLAEGVTVFTVSGTAGIETARDAGEGMPEMVQTSTYTPEKAKTLVDDARGYLHLADAATNIGRPGPACKMLQESAERALKALIVANRSRFAHTHELAELWDRAEELDGRIGARRDDDLLNTISGYAGDLGYDSPKADESAETFNAFREIAENLLTHTERRVRDLVPDDGPKKAKAAGRESAGQTGGKRSR